MLLLRTIQPLGAAARPSCRVCLASCSRRTAFKLQATRPRYQSSSAEENPKPFYVTTPIFYVNSTPHIGHVHSLVLADVFRRWESLKGNETMLCTGTDEHGLKVQRSAEAAQMPTLEFCDSNAASFREVADEFIGGHDAGEHSFIRTTDPRHADAVQEAWRTLNERGYLYESVHRGWYSVRDECFFPEDMLTQAVDPVFGKPQLVTATDKSPVEWVEEKNYHFRLTAFRDRLLLHLNANPEWIRPRQRMAEARLWIEEKLEDLSVSRPTSRLHWGIPVPDDPSQTIYVWVDALLNYATNAGYPNWKSKETRDLGGWPADLHVIGKDILRFHAVYWPALLMALDLPLPRQLLSHGHWTLGDSKMSKSSGNGVDPASAVDRFGVEVVRWFLMRRAPFENDSAWDNIDVAMEHNTSLANTYGNLLSRLTNTPKWRLEPAVSWASKANPACEIGQDLLSTDVSHAMGKHRPDQAISVIIEGLRAANKYIDEKEPWKVAQASESTSESEEAARNETQDKVNPVLYQIGETLRICSILLQPFIRSKAGEALDRLGVAPDARSLDHARYGCDHRYGKDGELDADGRLTRSASSRKLLFDKNKIFEPEARRPKWTRPKQMPRKLPPNPFMRMMKKVRNHLDGETPAN